MSNTGESDEELIGRYARGEVAAFAVLYRRHELRTWRYLERNVGNRATAEELLQEVWFAVARDAVRSTRPQLSLETVGYEAPAVVAQLTTEPSVGPLAAAVLRDQALALNEA